MHTRNIVSMVLGICVLIPHFTQAALLEPGFTYHGRLAQNGVPVNGAVDLAFSLWDAAGTGSPPVGGNQIGGIINLPAVPVADGLFTVLLNAAGEFGTSAFTGQARWLQVAVNGAPLAPRQPVTAAPYALYAASVGAPWSLIGPNIYFNGGSVGIGTSLPSTLLDVRGAVTLETGASPAIYTGTGSSELNRYLQLLNSPGLQSASGLMAGGVLVSDSYSFASPGKNDLIVKGKVGVGTPAPGFPLHVYTSFGYGLVHTDGAVQVGSYVSAQGGWLGTKSNHPLHLFTNDSSPRVTLTTAGDLTTTGNLSMAGNLAVGVQTTNNAKLEVYETRVAHIAIHAVHNNPGGGVAIRGDASASSGVGVSGLSSGSGIGVYADGQQADGYAGFFDGRVTVVGSFSANNKFFCIDHPLDPANKYLRHSCVESPDMMNIYNGNVTTDDRGYATVTLPDWFEALNRDFRYQLTVIDDADGEDFVQVKVTRQIAEGKFTLRTSHPLTQVPWQVTGIRKDAYAEAHPTVVEEDKPLAERGRYLYPELYGKPADYAVSAAKLRTLAAAHGERDR